MTPLHEQLALLRADLTSRIAPPPLESVLHRPRAPRPTPVAGPAAVVGHATVTRRRRRWGAALAAIGVVAAVTAGALIGRAGQHAGTIPAAPKPATVVMTTRPATPALAAHPTTGPSTIAATPRIGSAPDPDRALIAAEMTDTRHGFALFQSCTGTQLQCRVTTMAATQDGSHWVEHPVPTAPAHADPGAAGAPSPALTALGGRAVFYQAAPSGPRSGFFSADAGASWTEVAPGVTGTTATIPEHAGLQAVCPTGGSDPCVAVALTVRLPDDGRLVKLAHQPDLVVESAGTAPLADGSWWVSGTRAGKRALAVSRDQGRSWTTTTLPVLPGQHLFTSSVTGDDGRLWALAIGQLPEVKNGLLGVYRSTDNGATWFLARTAATGRPPRSALGVALASGEQAVICDESMPQQGWRSTDGGATFTPTTCPAAGVPQWTQGGYVSSDGATVSLSPDGVRWTHTTP